MKKMLSMLLIVLAVASCKKDEATTTTPANTANTLTFDSTFHNVTLSSYASGTKWQFNAVITLPPSGGFAKTLAFNMKFSQHPIAGTYNIVTTDADITATTANLYINYVDGNPSPTGNISTSYFLKSGTIGVATVSIVSGKAVIKLDGLTLTGNRGGGDKANVAANLTEN